MSIGIQSGPWIGVQEGPARSAGSRPEAAELSGGADVSGWRGSGSDAGLKTPALVAGLDDIAGMGEPVEERGRHLDVAEGAWPFAEGQVRGDADRSSL